MVLPVEFKRCDEEAMKVKPHNGFVTEISKNIPESEGEGEFIGITKIGRSILPDLKKATKELMKNKEFSSYFEGTIQKLIDWGGYKIKVMPTGGYFWGEIDFLDDYNKACERMPENLVELARKELG